MAIAFDANLGNVTDNSTLTTSAAAASNSRILLFVAVFGTEDLTSVAGGGLTWVIDVEVVGGSGIGVMICSADAPSGLASSTNITTSWSSGPTFGPGLAAASFTGLQTGASGYLDDVSSVDDAVSDAWSTGSIVTTNADDLLVAISTNDDRPTNTPSGGASEIHQFIGEGTNAVTTEYRIVSSTGTYTLAGTWSGGAAVFIQTNVGASYKATSVPPVPGPALQVVRPGVRWR